jgi:hypothetical protein
MQATARITGFVFRVDAPEDRRTFMEHPKVQADGICDIEVDGLPCAVEHPHDSDCSKTRLGIPFARGGFRDGRMKVWGWDGNVQAPTLTPSYLTWWTHGDGVEVRFHCFVRQGRLEVLGDSVIGLLPIKAV